MSLQIKKDSGSVYDPVFLKILEDIPGGVTIKTNRFPTTAKEVRKGAMLMAMTGASIGLYNVIKTIRLTADGDSDVTVLAVEPTDHIFKVGDYIHLYGGTSATILRVTTTAIAIESALAHADIASGTVLEEVSTAAGTTPKYDASGILRDTVEVRLVGVETLLDNIFAGVVVRGTVDESELPYFVTSADKTALTDRMRFA